jgi:hypothetical protein
MRTRDVYAQAAAMLGNNPELTGIPVLRRSSKNFNKDFGAAMDGENSPGVVLTLALVGGVGDDPDRDDIALETHLVVTLGVNPEKYQGALEPEALVVEVLGAIHRHVTGRGRTHWSYGNPAWELGDTRSGILYFFINFAAKTEDPQS